MTGNNVGAAAADEHRQHGVKGVYYGGEWLDIEDCVGLAYGSTTSCDGCLDVCPRSQSRHSAAKGTTTLRGTSTTVPIYDVCLVGAGCIGAAIARELARLSPLSVLWVEAADDVSQGATKGNSGIVHAGYDDAPCSVRAQHCWPGNQTFADLDRDLHFGYQINGSLVVAFTANEVQELERLQQRGEQNGVQRLRIVQQEELRRMEPAIHPDAIAALYAPDAGNVIPYEFAIALAENAVDNGVELRIRTLVTAIEQTTTATSTPENGWFLVQLDHWEPSDYLAAVATATGGNSHKVVIATCLGAGAIVGAHWAALQLGLVRGGVSMDARYHVTALVLLSILYYTFRHSSSSPKQVTRSTPLQALVEVAGVPVGSGGSVVSVKDMLTGGSGSVNVMHGQMVSKSQIQCRYVINCAGGAADQIAAMIGDDSFKIKPRLGDYILLNRNQVRTTLFPFDSSARFAVCSNGTLTVVLCPFLFWRR